MFTPTNSFLLLGFYVCQFRENQSRYAGVRVHADGHTDRGKLVLSVYAIAME